MNLSSQSRSGSLPAAAKKGGKTSRFILAGCGVMFLILCLCCVPSGLLASYLSGRPSGSNYSTSTKAEKPVIAMAVNLAASKPRLSVFIGDAKNDRWVLPAGKYYIEVKDDKNTIYTIGQKTLKSSSSLDIASLMASVNGNISTSRSRELTLITELAVGIANGEMTFLSKSSNGFKDPLFQSAKEWSAADLTDLYTAYSPVLNNEKETIAALTALENRAGGEAGYLKPDGLGRNTNGILSSIAGFFTGARDVDRRAVDDILNGSKAMTADEKADAFRFFTDSMTGGAKNFDELIQKLKDGQLNNQANRIRSFLCDEATFYNALQKDRKTNRPMLQIAHDEGALLVEKGAELEVEIVKSVLQNAFPGIEKGFDYADKINKWAELIRKTYNNPLAGAGEAASGYATDSITEQVKHGLLDMGIDETAADEMSGALTVEILGQLTKHDEEVEELAARATLTAEADSTEVEEKPTRTARPPTAANPPKKTPTAAPTELPAAPKCDAMDNITVLSGKIINAQAGGCVYEAMVRNSNPSKNVLLAFHLTSGGLGTYRIPAGKTLGTPFNMNAGNKVYHTDWFVAIFDTPECEAYYHGMDINQFPENGFKKITANYPGCN